MPTKKTPLRIAVAVLALVVVGLVLIVGRTLPWPGWPGATAEEVAVPAVPKRTPVPGGEQPLAAACFGEEALVRGDEVTAYQAFRARAGDPRAEFHLGIMFRDGRGVPRNPQAAMEHFLRAANAGDRDAMTALGWMYRGDPETGRNYPQALQWFERAARAGDRLAQFHLAEMYRQGNGTTKDVVRAWAWLGLVGDATLDSNGTAVPGAGPLPVAAARDNVYRELTRDQLASAAGVTRELKKGIDAAAASTKNNKVEVPACAP